MLMNRSQRRKLMKGMRNFQPQNIPMPKVTPPKPAADGNPDFSDVPLVTVCQSIRLLINELRSRGYPVYDFDHKEKSVQSIQIIRDKVYFMAAEEAAIDGKAQMGDEDGLYGEKADG